MPCHVYSSAQTRITKKSDPEMIGTVKNDPLPSACADHVKRSVSFSLTAGRNKGRGFMKGVSKKKKKEPLLSKPARASSIHAVEDPSFKRRPF